MKGNKQAHARYAAVALALVLASIGIAAHGAEGFDESALYSSPQRTRLPAGPTTR